MHGQTYVEINCVSTLLFQTLFVSVCVFISPAELVELRLRYCIISTTLCLIHLSRGKY